MADSLGPTPAMFEAVIRNMREGLVILDGQRTIRYCNASAERLLGWTSDELAGKAFAVQPVGEPSVQEIEMFLGRVGQSGQAATLEIRVQPRGANPRDISLSAAPIHPLGDLPDDWPDNWPETYISIEVADITATRATLARQSSLESLNEILVDLGKDLSIYDIFPKVVKSATMLVRGDAGVIAVMDESTGAVTFPYLYNIDLDDEAGTILRDISLVHHVVTMRQSIVIDDLRAHPLGSIEWIEFGARSVVAVPLQARGKVVGAIVVLSLHRTRDFSSQEVAVLETVGRQASITLDNAMLFAAVARSQQEWVQTVDAIPDMIFQISPAQTIIRANRAAYEYTARPLGRLVGLNCCSAVDIWQFAPGKCSVAQVLREKRSTFLEINDNDSGRTWHVWAYPVLGQRGRVDSVIEYIKDVTELKQSERKAAQAHHMAVLGQLTAYLAHEINNPLTGILGFSGFLVKQLPPDNPMRPDLEIIEKEALRARNIVKDILDFGKPREPKPAPSDLNGIVLDAVDMVKRHAEILGVSLTAVCAPDLPPVLADERQIKEVIVCLLMNALQAMDKKSGVIMVSTVFYKRLKQVAIEVVDQGGGIQEAALHRIFEPFFSTKKDSCGTGLSLALSREIVEKHGGTIKVESREGYGSVFKVLLPISG